mgnify:CR=1 FL=1
MAQKTIAKNLSDQIKIIDEKLSKRFIALDPKGYFIIKLNISTDEIIAEHYSNFIDAKGKAINPETGKPLGCKGSVKRTPINIFKGKSAKEIGIQLTEASEEELISSTDHALYLGRELQKAEECLKNKKIYIQD